jgi:crotonobetaine/carnitine-CoA ligase
MRFPTREECVLADLLERRAGATPDKVFLVFAEREWTYRDTAAHAWQFANGLIREGVAEGDYVSVWMPTHPDLVEAWFGVNAAGAVYAPLNLAARGRYLEHTLNIAESRVLVAHAKLVDRLLGLDLPHLETVVVTGGAPEIDLPWRMITMDEVRDGASPERPALGRPREPWDDMSLIYTSGTTGPSKGVRAAYATFWNYHRVFLELYVGEEDRFLQPLPMFHTAGTGITYSMLLCGGSVALLERFSARGFLDDSRRLGATATLVLHAMTSFLLAQPPRADDRDNPIRVAYMGPLSHAKEFSERFGISIFTNFGMTEAPGPLASGLNPENRDSCGIPVDPVNYEVRLVDEHDLPVARGTPGELVLRHSLPWMINLGYKNMPEATARAWRNGWFHTGDQFREDEAGNFYFLDRVKDAIRRRGENISSYEVEAEILEHPDVREVAVVAVANPDVAEESGDEEVKAVVVLEEGRELDPARLIAFLVPRMPRYWLPRFVEFTSELPRTESYKVKKADLRAAGITPGTWDRERAGVTLERKAVR